MDKMVDQKAASRTALPGKAAGRQTLPDDKARRREITPDEKAGKRTTLTLPDGKEARKIHPAHRVVITKRKAP